MPTENQQPESVAQLNPSPTLLPARHAIILVDDDRNAGFLQQLVEECGFRCRVANSTQAREELQGNRDPDLLVLDIYSPRVPALAVLRQFRRGGGTSPALVVSAVETIELRAEILSHWADDFILRPFEIADFQARIRALMRRPRTQRFLWRFDGRLRLDPATCTVTWAERSTVLTPTHFGIVWILAVEYPRSVSIEQLCQQLFNSTTAETVEKCRAHISKTRSQLARLGTDLHLDCTVRLGYSLVFRVSSHPGR